MASSSNFGLVHVFLVTFMMVALVVQDSAAQRCLNFGASCDIGNQSSCCSGSCNRGLFGVGNNATCGCTLDGPCATKADCCTSNSPFGFLGLPEPVLTCSKSKCTVVPPPICLSSGARCDTGNQNSCCSGLCIYRSSRDNIGTCACTSRGPCATNADCCDRSLLPVGPQAQVSICSDYRCTVGPRPTCLPIGDSCDTGNESSCCSGRCIYISLRSNIGTCACSSGPCATNADCCPRDSIRTQMLNLIPTNPVLNLIPTDPVQGCMNSRCV